MQHGDRGPRPTLQATRLAAVAAVFGLLAGCASSEPAFLANGQEVVRITCDLAINGMTACFRTAGDTCGQRGYVIYNWNGDPWIRPYPDPETLQDDPGLAASGLLIACRA